MYTLTSPSDSVAENFVICVTGPTGRGKTSFAMTASDKTLLLDIEKKAYRAHWKDAPILQVRDTDGLSAWKEFPEFDTVVIDTLDSMVELLVADISTNDFMRIQDWGSLAVRAKKVMSDIQAAGKNLVIVAHERIVRDDNNNAFQYLSAQGPAAKDKLMRDADLVGRFGTMDDGNFAFDCRHRDDFLQKGGKLFRVGRDNHLALHEIIEQMREEFNG